MFQHILLPTDGPPASKSAIRDCLKFAKETNAKVTGLHVVPEYHVFAYQTEMLEDTKEQFAKHSEEYAKKHLAEIENAAREEGVTCDTLYMTNDHPHEAIIKAALAKRCDLIAMASHGRRGVKGFLLGSETQKVLTHSQIPVLVYR